MPRRRSRKNDPESAHQSERRDLAAKLGSAAFGVLLLVFIATLVWSAVAFDPKKGGAVAHQERLVRECKALYARATTGADTAAVDDRYPDGYVARGPSCGGLRQRGTLGR